MPLALLIRCVHTRLKVFTVTAAEEILGAKILQYNLQDYYTWNADTENGGEMFTFTIYLLILVGCEIDMHLDLIISD